MVEIMQKASLFNVRNATIVRRDLRAVHTAAEGSSSNALLSI